VLRGALDISGIPEAKENPLSEDEKKITNQKCMTVFQKPVPRSRFFKTRAYPFFFQNPS